MSGPPARASSAIAALRSAGSTVPGGLVGGGVDPARVGGGGEPLADRLRTVLEGVLLGGADVDRPPLRVADEVRVARVVGIAQDAPVARIEGGAEPEEDRG